MLDEVAVVDAGLCLEEQSPSVVEEVNDDALEEGLAVFDEGIAPHAIEGKLDDVILITVTHL